MWRAQKAIYVGRTWKSVSRVVCEMVVLKRDYYVRENAYSGKATLMRSRYTRSVPGMRSEYTKTSDIHFPKNRGEWNRGMNTSLKGNFWNECKKHCTCHTLTKEFFFKFLVSWPFFSKRDSTEKSSSFPWFFFYFLSNWRLLVWNFNKTPHISLIKSSQ